MAKEKKVTEELNNLKIKVKILEKENSELKRLETMLKISEEKLLHLNQVLRAIRNINQLIVREQNREALLSGICNLLEKARNYSLVWIGKLDEKTKHVIPISWAGKSYEYLFKIKITYDEAETGKGPTGTAARTRKPDICQDITKEPRMNPWKEIALKYGFLSSSSFPIIWKEKIYGVLCVYSENPNIFVSEEVELLNEISDDIALALYMIETEDKRKASEEALKRSEEKFRNLFNRVPVGLYRTSIVGEILDANKALANILGFDEPSSLIGLNAFDFFVDYEDRERQRKILEEKGQIQDYDMKIRRRDGEIIWIRDNTVLSQDTETKAIYHEGSIIDITPQMEILRSLRDSENNYRELFDNAPVGYHEVNTEGRITKVNLRELQMLGYTHEEMIGHYLWDFNLEQESRDSLKAKLKGELQVGKAFERTYIKKDGTLLNVLVEDNLIKDENGRITGLRSTIQDITELKRLERERENLEAQLRQSQRMESIGLLAGGIAHDFNNILSIIIGTCDLCLLEIPRGNPLRLNLEEIKRASIRAADLTHQLLAFGRKQIMELKIINLNLLIKNLEKMLQRIIGEDIELRTFLNEDLGNIKADPSQIEQVILNLIVNAKDAMPKGGKLTIETSNVELDEGYAQKHIGANPGPHVMLSITDTGQGMTQEIKERIFEPFFTTKERGKGTGLGLSTVYGIVKQSEGNIWVYSEPEKGTTFKIYFPIVKEDAEIIEEKITTHEIPGGNETIIVVEDEEPVRKLAFRILEKKGYNVLEAKDGEEAIFICKNYDKPIHLILTDVVMPRMSGKELVERLKFIHPEVKSLFMSGYTDNAIATHGILEEGIKYLQKPFTIEGLLRKVRDVLNKK